MKTWSDLVGAGLSADGYGIWIRPSEGRACSYAMVGEDPGVAFSSTYDPGSVVLCCLLGNTVDATWAMLGAITPVLEGA